MPLLPEVRGYRLLELLGEGAAGEVYLATPKEKKTFADPGDPLALKLYKPEILRQPNQRDRIETEFTIGSKIVHPNLVRMLECDIKEERPWLVMEYVDGVPLDTWVRMFQRIPVSLAARIAKQIIDGIRALHEREIVHRDIKPQNVMVSSGFEAKVMDFGVAGVPQEFHAKENFTPPHKFLGTIRNSSPELLYGQPYDHRTDLYSFGTVLYCVLHGEEVFSEEKQFARLSRLVREVDPTFDRAIEEQTETGRMLANLIRSLLAKDAASRPATAQLVVESVEAMLPQARVLETAPLNGYVATALTGLDADAKEAIAFASAKIADVCKEFGIFVYQPRRATDPLANPSISAEAVYYLDRKRVLTADLLLILANYPSLGVGQEIEIASALGTPALLLRRNEGGSLSRMVTGSYLNLIGEPIIYGSPEELERSLRWLLNRKIEEIRAVTKPKRTAEHSLGSKLATLRAGAGLSLEEAAAGSGLSARLLAAIEEKPIWYHNAGVDALQRVCAAYGTTLSDILRGASAPVRSSVLVEDGNLKRLEHVAKTLDMTAKDFLQLRGEYLRERAAHGAGVTVSDAEWMARYDALQKAKVRGQTEFRF